MRLFNLYHESGLNNRFDLDKDSRAAINDILGLPNEKEVVQNAFLKLMKDPAKAAQDAQNHNSAKSKSQ